MNLLVAIESDDVHRMSTVAKIESAIERLSRPQLSELAEWFEEFEQMIFGSSEVFAMDDREEESYRKTNVGKSG